MEDVSHELRNPVAVVQANVEAVLANDDATASEREHALAVISRATSRMSRLLEDLLATARRRSGSFADQNVDLNAFVNEVVDEHRLLAHERPLDVTTRIARGPVVYADPESLARALANLLSNAIRLAPAEFHADRRQRQCRWLGVDRSSRRGAGHRRGGTTRCVRPVSSCD